MENLEKKVLSEKELDAVTGGSWASFWQWIKEHVVFGSYQNVQDKKDQKKSLFI